VTTDLVKNGLLKHDFFGHSPFLSGDRPTSICSIFPIGI